MDASELKPASVTAALVGVAVTLGLLLLFVEALRMGPTLSIVTVALLWAAYLRWQ